ncbi:MAG: S8 family serine peptidase [Chloroflexi bacterium]|nr:S8 family serine peptidase [Chloroflexota bacterium]
MKRQSLQKWLTALLAFLAPASMIFLLVFLQTTYEAHRNVAHAAGPKQDLPRTYAPGEIVIRMARQTSSADRAALLSSVGLQPMGRIESLGYWRLSVPAGQEKQFVRRMRADRRVAYAGVDHLLHIADTIPDDGFYPSQWGLTQIQAPHAWDVTTGTAEFTIAIVDTGVDLGHLDLTPKLVAGATFVTGTTSPYDDHGHGTHVAGVAGAATNNGRGVAGVSWLANIMPIKVLAYDGYGTEWDVAQGVLWATGHGADVINLSLAGEEDVPVLHDALDFAHRAGVLSVAAAGNCGDPLTYSYNGCSTYNPALYPAAYTQTMAVAATTQTDQRASFSEIQSYVDIGAPGTSIWSTWTGGLYAYLSGTSQATPFVSGVATLVWSLRPDDTNDQIQALLEATADDVNNATNPGWDTYLGWGRLNAFRAVQRAAPLDLTVTKDDGRSIARVGERLTYTLHFTNSGFITATNVQITETLWAPLDYQSSNPAFASLGNGQWHLAFGDMPPNSSGTATFIASVPLTVSRGTMVTNSVSIGNDGSQGADASAWNNQYQDVDRVVAPVLAVSPTALIFLSDTVTAPRNALFTISNVGSDSLHWQAGTGSSWLALSPPSGTVASGTPVTVTTFVLVDQITQTGLYTATLTISSDTPGAQGSPRVVTATLSYVQNLLYRFIPIFKQDF